MPDQPIDEPLIYTPDAIDDKPENGLICFLDKDRQCGPDCMSWTHLPADQGIFNPQQNHCALLVNAERSGKHLVVLAKIFHDLLRTSRSRDPNAMPIPDPAGRPR